MSLSVYIMFMIYVLYIALGYLLITSIILFWNKATFSPLYSTKNYVLPTDSPSVSICIPARNEEKNIKKCVRSAVEQDYPNFEVIVLDDESSDRTPEILSTLNEQYTNRLQVINGQPKKQGWLGKAWACHQLSQQASGEILLFIDADTWLEPDTLIRTVRTMGRDVLDFLTVWPQQRLVTFWENTIIPLIYYVLTTLLPSAYVYKMPRWIPRYFRKILAPYFAAACGQFMAFKRTAYFAVGGHRAVKNHIIEDVALGRLIKKHGYTMNMYHGLSTVYCRMYRSLHEIKMGFQKKFLAGFNYNIFLFIAVGLLHFIVFLLPLLILPFTLIYGELLITAIASAVIAIYIFHRLILAKWFRWNRWYSLLHPLGVAWFQKLAISSLQNYFKNQSVQWKGRVIIRSKKE